MSNQAEAQRRQANEDLAAIEAAYERLRQQNNNNDNNNTRFKPNGYGAPAAGGAREYTKNAQKRQREKAALEAQNVHQTVQGTLRRQTYLAPPQLDIINNEEKKSKLKKHSLIFIAIILVALLLVLIFYIGYPNDKIPELFRQIAFGISVIFAIGMAYNIKDPIFGIALVLVAIGAFLAFNIGSVALIGSIGVVALVNSFYLVK